MSRMSSLTPQDHNVAGNNSPSFFSETWRFNGGGAPLNRELVSLCLKQSNHREARAFQTLRISLSRAGDTGIGGSPRCSSVIAPE